MCGKSKFSQVFTFTWKMTSIARHAIFFMSNEALTLMKVKTRQWPHYTNVCYKHTYESFNIGNEIYYNFQNNIT